MAASFNALQISIQLCPLVCTQQNFNEEMKKISLLIISQQKEEEKWG